MRIKWRTLEWLGCGLSLFLLSGAFIPLLLAGGGDLDDSLRSKLRLVALPAYLVTLCFGARHFRQILVALRRSLPLVSLLAIPVLSILWSISPSVSLRRAVGLLLSMGLAYVIAVRFTPRQLLAMMLVILAPCMLLSLAFAAAVPHLGIMPPDVGGVRGVYLHKNVLGWYAALTVVLAGIAFRDGEPFRRSVTAGIFALGLLCLLASGSMTSLIATATAPVIAWFYMSLARTGGSRRGLAILLAIQASILFVIALTQWVPMLLELLGKDATLTGRVPLWALVDEEIGRHLLIGSGYQAFWTEANPDAWRIWAEIQWMAPHSHNGYREILLNFGIFGFGLFVAMIIRALRQGAALHCARPEDGWLWPNVLIGMFLVMNLTESLFLVQNECLFVLFAAAIVMFALREPELVPARSGPAPLILAGPVRAPRAPAR